MNTLTFAHRGFSGKYPENTRRAFLAALEEGCDGIESDVHLSSDGEPVIIHDAELGRTCTARGKVGSYTFRELRELDIGSWKGSEFAGERILHLDELLEIILNARIILNLEIKNYEVFYEDIEEIVIGRIKALGAEKRLILSSFNHISMKKCKEIEPSIPAGLLYEYPLLDAPDYAARQGIDALHPHFRCLVYSPDLVQAAHDRGVKVNTWTVNTEEDIRFCAGLGVDSIISNFPDKLAGIGGRGA